MRLPSLNALRAFEAAARHGGFTGAAEELHVSRGAISRHVKLLEQELGVELFSRRAQGVELTEVGRRFLPGLTAAFESIGRQARQIASDKNDLRIFCPPTLSIRWLIPRLDQFRQRYPEIRIRLTTKFLEPDDFSQGDFDVGFDSGHPERRPAGLEAVTILPMVITPACSPKLLCGSRRLEAPTDLAGFTLLHENPDRNDWTTWLRAYEVPGVDPLAGEVFPNLDLAVRAAVMGEGIVMGDLILTRGEFETGQLVMPFPDRRLETDWGGFSLIGPSAFWGDEKVVRFRTWLLEIAGPDSNLVRNAIKRNIPDPGHDPACGRGGAIPP